MQNNLPATGYIRLPQIIGEPEVTPETAAANRAKADAIREKFPVTAKKDTEQYDIQKRHLEIHLAKTGPRNPRPATVGVYPVSKSTLYAEIKAGKFPAPVKLGARVSAWRVEDVRSHLEKATAGRGAK